MKSNDSSNTPIYVFNVNDNIDTYETNKLLVLLFTDKPVKRYRSQKEICRDLKCRLGVIRTQGAVSKAFQKLLGRPFIVKNTEYVITKYDGEYLLLNTAEYTQNLRHEMICEGMFSKESVYYQYGIKNPQTFVFWLCEDEKIQSIVQSNFEKMLTGGYLDIFRYKDKLIIMLDPAYCKIQLFSDILRNFFAPYYDAYKVIK